jgi:hypothetical protein
MRFVAVQVVNDMPVDVFRCPSCDAMEAKRVDEVPGLTRRVERLLVVGPGNLRYDKLCAHGWSGTKKLRDTSPQAALFLLGNAP